MNISNSLDQLAVNSFAAAGIHLSAIPERDFSWTHSLYYLSKPAIQDIKVEIRVGNDYTKVVHSEMVSGVHCDDAAKVSQSILDTFKECFYNNIPIEGSLYRSEVLQVRERPRL